MSVRVEDTMAQVLAGMPVVRLPWGHGTHVRRSDASTMMSTGDPMPLLTDAPDHPVALAVVGGWWPWHRICQHLRVPVVACLPAGITVDRIDGHRWLVTAPAGQMVVERVSRAS